MFRARDWYCPFEVCPADHLHHLTGRDASGLYLDEGLVIPLSSSQHIAEHQVWNFLGIGGRRPRHRILWSRSRPRHWRRCLGQQHQGRGVAPNPGNGPRHLRTRPLSAPIARLGYTGGSASPSMCARNRCPLGARCVREPAPAGSRHLEHSGQTARPPEVRKPTTPTRQVSVHTLGASQSKRPLRRATTTTRSRTHRSGSKGMATDAMTGSPGRRGSPITREWCRPAWGPGSAV